MDVDAQVVPPHYAKRGKVNITAEDFFQYWLWRCRSEQNDWSLHPLRDYDPKAPEYFAENLTEIQK